MNSLNINVDKKELFNLLNSAKSAKKWIELNFSDTDFDLDSNLAEIDADLHLSIYDIEKSLDIDKKGF